VLLQNTKKDKGTNRQRSISHIVQASSASVGLHWVYLAGEKGRVGRLYVMDRRWVKHVPTHTHKPLTWTGLPTSSSAKADILATNLATPQNQHRLSLVPEELLQQVGILLQPSAFCSTQ